VYKVSYDIYYYLFLISTDSYSQSTHWPGIPLSDKSGIVLLNQTTFIGVMSTAAVSYGLAQFVLKNIKSLHFYKARVGVVAPAKAQSLWKTRGLKKKTRTMVWFRLRNQ
jgi:hypothetical protein